MQSVGGSNPLVDLKIRLIISVRIPNRVDF